jgi:hypothetical protein
MKRFILSILIILSTVELCSQPKRFITIPNNAWEYTEARAAQVYMATREDYLIDTVLKINPNKSVYWVVNQYPDTVIVSDADRYKTYVFTIDSIVGRGDKRQALLTIKIPIKNNAGQWIRYKERYVALPDSSYRSIYDSVGVTLDSTLQRATWLWYTTFPGVHTANSKGVGIGKFEDLELGYNKYLTIWLEKVLGNPTENKGMDQQAMLHFQLKEGPPKDFIFKYLTP